MLSFFKLLRLRSPGLIKTISKTKFHNNSTYYYCHRLSSNICISRKPNATYDGYSKYFLYSGLLTSLGLKEKTTEEKEKELIHYMKRGVLLIQKEEFHRAEQMLHYALKLAIEHKNENGITYIYDLLANLAYDIGDYAKAERLFVEVMQRVMSSGALSDDNRIIHMSLKLAKIYEASQQFEKAENGYKFCIENLETKVNVKEDRTEDTLTLWAMSLDFYAHFLLNRKRMKEAINCFKTALEKCTEIYGKEHERNVVLLNDLGTVSNLMGDNDTALLYLQEAVSLGEKLPEMPDMASIYINLGRAYFFKQMYSESQMACERGKNEANKEDDEETESEANECIKQVKAVLEPHVS